MKSNFPPRPNRSALSESTRDSESGSNRTSEIETASSGDYEEENRPSVRDMADAFRRMERKTLAHSTSHKRPNRPTAKSKKTTKIQSPKQYSSQVRRSRSRPKPRRHSNPSTTEIKRLTKLEASLHKKTQDLESLQDLVQDQQISFKSHFDKLHSQEESIKRVSVNMRRELEAKQADMNDMAKRHKKKEQRLLTKICELEDGQQQRHSAKQQELREDAKQKEQELQEAVVRAEAKNTALLQRNSAMTEEIMHLNQQNLQIQRGQRKSHQISGRLEAVQRECEALQDQNDKFDAENRKLIMDMVAVEDVKTKMAELQREYDELHAQTASASSLERRIKELNAENMTLRSNERTATARNEQLTRTNARLQSDNERLKGDSRSVNQQLKAKTDELGRLSEQHANKQQDSKSQIRDLEHHLTVSQSEAEAQTSQAAASLGKIQILQSSSATNEALLHKQIAELNQQNATLFAYNQELNDTNAKLTEQKRMEDHVLKISGQERLEKELQRLKGEKMSDILKSERFETRSLKLKAELEDIRRVLAKTKRYAAKISAKLESRDREMQELRESLQHTSVLNQQHEASVHTDVQTVSEDASLAATSTVRKRSVFEEAVDSLANLFDGKLKERAERAAADRQQSSSSMVSRLSELSKDDPAQTSSKASHSAMALLREQLGSVKRELHDKEEALRRKEQELLRLKTENDSLKLEIDDFREQLQREEQLGEINKSQQNMEKMLETLYKERSQQSERATVLEAQLTHIVEQNQSLRNSIDTQIERQSLERADVVATQESRQSTEERAEVEPDEDGYTLPTDTIEAEVARDLQIAITETTPTAPQTDAVHAIPIATASQGVGSRRFSDLFLQQLHSPTMTSTNEDTDALFQRYTNENE